MKREREKTGRRGEDEVVNRRTIKVNRGINSQCYTVTVLMKEWDKRRRKIRRWVKDKVVRLFCQEIAKVINLDGIKLKGRAEKNKIQRHCLTHRINSGRLKEQTNNRAEKQRVNDETQRFGCKNL